MAMAVLVQPASVSPIVDPTADFNLQECPNCGRRFNDDVYNKHVSVCAKANRKRKAFNSRNIRVKAVQELNGPDAVQIIQQGLKKKDPPKKKAVPKWKIQSEQFRKAMRANVSNSDGIGGTYETPPEEDDRVQCPYLFL